MFRDQILQQVAHRPWPLPQGKWSMVQSWHDLLFAHWPVPETMLRPSIPPSLELDTYDGTAWLSIVSFRMSGVRPRNLPVLPWLSNFAELNVRTYVRLPDSNPDGPPETQTVRTRPGVLFFSLDAANPLAVEIARRFFHLPYFNAQMSCRERDGRIHYSSVRRDKRIESGEFEAVYGPTGGIQPAAPGTLEHWLSERYALYAHSNGQRKIHRGEIHHLPWPLQTAEAEIQLNTLPASVGLALPEVAPLIQFSRRLDVFIWPMRQILQQV